MAINDSALEEYATELRNAGFQVYEPKGKWNTFFVYSRMVEDKECFGVVQQESVVLMGYSHHMPIKPSRENGSGMFLETVKDGFDCLTVEAATKVASPTNSNRLVGSQTNWFDPSNYIPTN